MKHVPVLKIDTIKISNIYKICDFLKMKSLTFYCLFLNYKLKLNLIALFLNDIDYFQIGSTQTSRWLNEREKEILCAQTIFSKLVLLTEN